MTMVNSSGQKYTCMVPNTTASLYSNVGTVVASDAELDELLNSLEDGPCLYLNKDWWTYEFCYKKHIKQYHVERDVPVGEVITLGEYSPKVDPVEDYNKTYHPQWYENGSRYTLSTH